MMTTHFYSKDHPQARGREPNPGEQAYELTFPIDDGTELVIHCGAETFSRFAEMIGSMTLDDAAISAGAQPE